MLPKGPRSEIPRHHNNDIRLGILGLGHVGLPTALGLAELGWNVVGADDDQGKAREIAQGLAPIYEPGLGKALHKHLDTGRFRVVDSVAEAVTMSTVLFVCVGTPQLEDGSADLGQVERVARTIASHLNGYKLVIEKSTAPARTAERIKHTIGRYAQGGHEFDVAVNPEFFQEGTALRDFMNPDRVVLGVETERAKELLLRIYQPLLDAQQLKASDKVTRMLVTTLNAAELIKHSANAFLATKVSFINLVADLCDAVDADVQEVADALGLDPRIGPHFMRAGLGFGGACLPKDVQAFAHMGEANGVDMALLRTVIAINHSRTERFLSKVHQALWNLEGKTVAVWGLAFKPETDDVREAASLMVVASLQDEGASLRLFDPRAMTQFQHHFPPNPPKLVYCRSPLEAVEGAEALLVLTEWPQFREVDLAKVRKSMTLPIIVDGRNSLEPQRALQLGFDYHGMGRNPAVSRP